MIHLTISRPQKLVVDQNFHPVLIIMPSAAALGGLATSVCIRAGIYIRLWEKDLKKQVQRTAFAICPLYFGNRIVSTRNGLGDGTGSDVGKITVQNLHLFPLLVLPLDHVLASGLGSHPPYYIENA